MSFAIEVPGEANPLTLQGLCQALQSATSSDFTQRQTAGQQLTSWETQSGYYSSLQTVYLDKSIPFDVRFLAVIQLKNGIDRYWRLNDAIKNSIKTDEKNLIRSRLFQGTIEEEERNLGLHNALCTAKVIRIDYPSKWPDALGSLVELIRNSKNGNQDHLFGGLQLLLRVIKEMSSMRLRPSKGTLRTIAPEIVFILSEVYAEKSAEWGAFLSSGRGDGDEADLAMANSLFALRILRRLLIQGYDRPHSESTVEQFWTLTQNQFGQLLNFVSHDSNVPAPFQDVVGKHLLQFTKLHIDMCDSHAASFAFLPNSLSLIHAYWDLVAKFAEVFDKSDGIRQGGGGDQTAKSKVEGPLLERLALKGLLLLRSCVKAAFHPAQTFQYRTPETKAEQEQARQFVKTEVLKPDLVVQIVNSIITHLFVFRKADLEAWEEDPEEWEQQEQSEGNAYEWEVRPCAEKLFLDLLTNYKELLVPPLLEYFQTAQVAQADIGSKEAVYTAMGIAAAHVFNDFNFDSVLASTLVSDAQQQGGLNKVLRRRIAILISQWAPVKLEDASRPIIYQIFQHFLNPSDETNDLVVRITAARQIRWVADELGFSPEAFLPYATDILTQLIDLVQKVDVDETKLAILESIRIIVARMESHVAQFDEQLMTTLPVVWENSGSEEYMIKQAIIAIFTALVLSMGPASQRYQHLMIPLLSEAARKGSDLHVHLIDESLELWNTILMQSTPPLGPAMVDLVELALPLFEYETETASQALSAIEAYLLLAPSAMLEDRLRRPTLTALSGALDSRARDHVQRATVCIEYYIRCAVEVGGLEGVSVIIRDMLEIGLMRKILESLHDAWDANQTTGPNRKISKLSTTTERDYFAILARLALAEPVYFVQMLSSFGPLEQVWGWLSSEWFSRLADMEHIERQKLCVLGLSRLLELPSPMQELILGKLQDYMSMWVNTISELHDPTKPSYDSLIWESLEETEYDTPQSIAEREWLAKDPIHTLPARDFVKERFINMMFRLGGERVFNEQWAINVDKEVLQQWHKIME